MKRLNVDHSGELYRHNQSFTNKITKQEETHDISIKTQQNDHVSDISKKLLLFTTTKSDHSQQNNKNKNDHNSYYHQFKIVHNALLLKTQQESVKETMK